MVHGYRDNMSLSQISSFWPATKRILVEVGTSGELRISSTLESEEDTIQLLDEAMEAIDGQRMPPDGE